jgi:hypothetical protein
MSQTKEWMEEATMDLEGANKIVEHLAEKSRSDGNLRNLFLNTLDEEIRATDQLLNQLKVNYVAVRAHKEFLIRHRKHAQGDRV